MMPERLAKLFLEPPPPPRPARDKKPRCRKRTPIRTCGRCKCYTFNLGGLCTPCLNRKECLRGS